MKSLFFATLLMSSASANALWNCAAYCGHCEMGFTDCSLVDKPEVLTSESHGMNAAFRALEATCKELIPSNAFPVLATGNRNVFTPVLPADVCRPE